MSVLDPLAYVVVREDLTSPLIRSQVVDVLQTISREKSAPVSLVWFYRVDFLFGRQSSLQVLRNDLRARGIVLSAIPFVSLGFPVNAFLLPLVLPQWLAGLLWIYLLRKKRIFHCRSYHSALAAAALKSILPIKLIFDPRSPFPEENVAAGTWRADGLNFSAWKKLEGSICRHSDLVIAISRPFADSLLAENPHANVVVIPNNYPQSFDDSERPAPNARKNGLSVCYVGSFGHWNSPVPYLKFIDRVRQYLSMPVEVTFLVQAGSRRYLSESIRETGFACEGFTVISATQDEVIGYLSNCDIGLQIMQHADDRLSVKFVEYLSAGLPVIVSENVRGASDVAEKERVGFVLLDDQSNAIEAARFMTEVVRDREAWRTRCRSTAVRLFSPRAVASLLAAHYVAVAEQD